MAAPSLNERVMLYVRQETEDVYTPLHVVPPTTQGLLNAVSTQLFFNVGWGWTTFLGVKKFSSFCSVAHMLSCGPFSSVVPRFKFDYSEVII